MNKTLQKIGVLTFACVLALPALASLSASAEVTKNMCSGLVRDLTLGSTGSDVVTLQTFLEEKGYLTIPVGVSKGYFGSLTKAGLAKYQAANGIVPVAGYFGPITRGKLVSACATSVPTPGNNSGEALKGGDGDFKSFKVLGTPSSEDVYEGQDVKVLGFEFKANDSDLLIDRIELLASSTSGTVKKPWKVLDEISIYNGSKKVASIDASDKDNWDEVASTDTYTIKLSGLKSIVREDDKAKFYVEVTAKDSFDTADLGSWSIGLTTDGLRAINAEKIDVYEGSTSDKKTFTLKEAKSGSMTITVDDADNKDKVISVDDSNDTNDEIVYLAEVKSKTGTNNVEKVTITSSASDTDAVGTLYLFIDGDEVGSESYGTTVTFDDLDVDIDEGDKIEFEVRADINDTNNGARYSNGTTFKVTGMTVNYVDENDDDQTITSTTDGGLITFSTTSVMVSQSGSSVAKQIGADETKGAFSVSFKVTAPEDEDIFISKAGSSAYSFEVIDASTGATTTATTSSVTLAKVSGGSTSGSYYLISAGSTATFTATVNIDNTGAIDRSLRIGLTAINYKVGSTSASTESYTSGMDEDYETPDLQLFGVDAQ